MKKVPEEHFDIVEEEGEDEDEEEGDATAAHEMAAKMWQAAEVCATFASVQDGVDFVLSSKLWGNEWSDWMTGSGNRTRDRSLTSKQTVPVVNHRKPS